MVLFTLSELFDLFIMVVGLGYIFMGSLSQPRTPEDLLKIKRGFAWDNFMFAVLITAPAIVLHEMAHKFAALFLGLYAEFHASYFGLGLGILLRIFNSPFIVFVPGFVRICGDASCTLGVPPLYSALTAFVGPGMNLLLYVLAYFVLKRARKLTYRQKLIWHVTKQINLFLFIFNMIPLPPFDGFSVFSNLLKLVA